MRLSALRWALNPVTDSKEDTDTEGEDHVKTRDWSDAATSPAHLGPPEAGRGMGQSLPQAPRGTNPVTP